MELHASTGGGLPLPVNGNDRSIRTLQPSGQSAQASTTRKPTAVSYGLMEPEAAPQAGITRETHCEQIDQLATCGQCGIKGFATDGYFRPGGGFYCDECVWILADNGEFYCG